MMRLLLNKIRFKIRLKTGYLFVNARRFIRERRGRIQDPLASSLRVNGFVKTRKTGSLGLTTYLRPHLDSLSTESVDKSSYFTVMSRNEHGLKSVAVDLNAGFLHEFVFTEELYRILNQFYGGAFYLRNNPTIEFGYPEEIDSAQKFHLDWGLRQVSVMVNLLDLDESSMHMQYVKQSNRRYYFHHPDREDPRQKMRVDRDLQSLDIDTTMGPEDTVSIFDAGCGYHRQVPGGKRIILHLNFTDNLTYTYWDKDWESQISDDRAKYWFSNYTDTSSHLIKKSGLPASLFSLVYRKIPAGLGVPKIYTSPRQFKSTSKAPID